MAKKNSLLWEIDHPLTGVRHFLYGTMHVRNDDAYQHIGQAEALLTSCESYVGEMDLNDPVLSQIEDHFHLPYSVTLESLYGERKYIRMRKIIRRAFEVDIEIFKELKPMIVANIIAEKLLTATYDKSLDHHLWQFASEKDLPCHGLESGQDQINILNSIPLGLQKPMLRAVSKNIGSYRKKVLKLSKKYASGDISALYKMTKSSLGKLRKPLLYSRNHHMADRVVELTSDGPAFIAFGAAHLGGKNGVLRLIKKSGYKVKAI